LTLCAFISCFFSLSLSLLLHSRVCIVLYDAFEVCACVCKTKNFEYKQNEQHNLIKKIVSFLLLFFQDEIDLNFYAIMFLLIIILSYLLGCASTVALILYFYTRYTSNRPVVINEKQDEQFSLFHPLSEVRSLEFRQSKSNSFDLERTSKEFGSRCC